MKDIESTSDYDKQEEAIKKRLDSAGEGTEILKSKAKENKMDKPEVHQNCEVARMLLSEGLEMYESGEMSFDEFIEDLHKSLLAIQKVE
ncbi:MAG: hypothetical protein AAB900_02090 [Patescibacteria group bacterium]